MRMRMQGLQCPSLLPGDMVGGVRPSSAIAAGQRMYRHGCMQGWSERTELGLESSICNIAPECKCSTQTDTGLQLSPVLLQLSPHARQSLQASSRTQVVTDRWGSTLTGTRRARPAHRRPDSANGVCRMAIGARWKLEGPSPGKADVTRLWAHAPRAAAY